MNLAWCVARLYDDLPLLVRVSDPSDVTSFLINDVSLANNVCLKHLIMFMIGETF